jgi:hypothetical protein
MTVPRLPCAHSWHRAEQITRIAALSASFAIALAGCATSVSPPPAATRPPSAEQSTDLDSRIAIAEWQRRLEVFITGSGGPDLTALERLPALRSPAVTRPGQIVFAATDIEALTAERDGFDVFGMLVGRRDSTTPRFIFIVGTVAREAYRPVALADIRAVSVAVRDGTVAWEVGPGNSQALQLYLKGLDATSALRFPNVHDQFRLTDCTPAVCVEELRSGARWALYAAVSKAPSKETAPTAGLDD